MPLSAQESKRKKATPKPIGGSMSGAFIGSGIFHVLILVLGMVAIPHTVPDIVINEPFPVELVEVDLITQTNKAPKPKEATPPDEPAKPETVDTDAPPDLLNPKPAEPVEEIPEAENITEPEPEPEPEIEPEKPKEKPKPKPKTGVTKKEPEAPRKDFQSLLKNLTPKAPKDEKDVEAAAENTDDAPDIDRLADRLTMSEEDALRAQLAQCWNVMAGAKYAEDLVVAVKVNMNPDRTVRSASIADQLRYNRDSHFRAAADAALRALRNPRCTPLKLPENKYEEWKTITIRFDPRQML